MRIRKNVWKLPAGDQTLYWYGRAVEEMQRRLIADPTSWRYQGAIHEYVRQADPLRQPADVLPPTSEQRDFWNQCQHGSWFFLSWHRMYLLHFESIVAAAVQQSGGPADWALPYWNYSDHSNPSLRLLPPAFRPNPDGSPNPLHVAARDPRCNAGQPFADARDVDIAQPLRNGRFQSGSIGGAPGFGGPATAFEHSGNRIGVVEGIPHGSIHGRVGGLDGWMSRFNTAALDPIFWLHHANIDRLWEVWRKRDEAHQNPTGANWLRNVSFKFHDAARNIVVMTSEQVRDTTAAALSYQYDDTTDPLSGVAPAAPSAVDLESINVAMAAKPIPELIGATRTEFDLDANITEATVEVRPAAGPALESTTAPRWILNIENITCDGQAPAYDVYLNVPPAEKPEESPNHFVGRLPMFGLEEASRPGIQHPGSGLQYSFEITDLVARLSQAADWDPANLRLSFVPVGAPTGSRVKVGRVSVYAE